MPRSKPLTWSAWKKIPLRLSPEVLRLVLDDGQAFRWHAQEDKSWLGFFGPSVLRLRLDPDQNLEWSSPESFFDSTEKTLHAYLALDSAFDHLSDCLPWRSDPHLARCMRAYPGLRLLRQPLGETLLCFLCSSTKQIPQIKLMAEAMARSLGEKLCPPDPSFGPALSFCALPTWSALHRCKESELRACGLGFRAAYVKGCAAFFSDNPTWLEASAQLPYQEAHARLCTLPGVGAKIADCVLLYSGAHLEAFPVDTWIIKTMARRYHLEGWKPEAIAHFGRQHFGAAAGLAQQYLFNFERHEKTD